MVLRRFRILAAAAVAIALGAAPGLARAETAVPDQGPWSGITSVGLPVHFTVEGSSVTAAKFGFHWGFCGNFVGEASGPAVIDPEGHWNLADPRGSAIEATVVAADRIEGAVTAVERELPGCPSTHATFFAIPGETLPPAPPQYYAVMNTESGFQIRMPELIYLGRFISFALIHVQWTGWGQPVAQGVGQAEVRQYRREYTSKATVTLSRPIADGPGKRLYSLLRFHLTGSLPPRYPHSGWFKFDRQGVVSASDGRWPGGPGYVKHPNRTGGHGR